MGKLAESEHNFCWSYKNLSSCDPLFRYVNLIRVLIRTLPCVRLKATYSTENGVMGITIMCTLHEIPAVMDELVFNDKVRICSTHVRDEEIHTKH